MGRGATPLQTSLRGNPGREWEEDACIAYSRCGRINALYNWRKTLGVRAVKDRFRLKKHSTGFFSSMGNVIVGTKSCIQEKP